MAIKRRKPKTERKETSIRIRLTADQKDTLTQAATESGLDLSGWIRDRALKSAKKERQQQ